jgi:hypothetical protein
MRPQTKSSTFENWFAKSPRPTFADVPICEAGLRLDLFQHIRELYLSLLMPMVRVWLYHMHASKLAPVFESHFPFSFHFFLFVFFFQI